MLKNEYTSTEKAIIGYLANYKNNAWISQTLVNGRPKYARLANPNMANIHKRGWLPTPIIKRHIKSINTSKGTHPPNEIIPVSKAWDYSQKLQKLGLISEKYLLYRDEIRKNAKYVETRGGKKQEWFKLKIWRLNHTRDAELGVMHAFNNLSDYAQTDYAHDSRLKQMFVLLEKHLKLGNLKLNLNKLYVPNLFIVNFLKHGFSQSNDLLDRLIYPITQNKVSSPLVYEYKKSLISAGLDEQTPSEQVPAIKECLFFCDKAQKAIASLDIKQIADMMVELAELNFYTDRTENEVEKEANRIITELNNKTRKSKKTNKMEEK
jgi:hypothetical protein